MEILPAALPASQGVACCDVVQPWRLGEQRLSTFSIPWTARPIALDVKTGKPVWRTRIGNINIGESITMAPVVAGGRVYVGNSGGELGVRGWVVALDEETGKLDWKAYNTGPDRDVLIDSAVQAFLRQRQRHRPGP